MKCIPNKKILSVKLTIMVLLMAVFLYSYSSGPPPGYTGGFGQETCQACHAFGPSDGSFSIMGVPAQYTPGTTYPLTVELSQSGQQRWGFQLASRFDADGTQAGMLIVTDKINTQLVEQTGIQYIEHTFQGTYMGTPDGPVNWTFDWTAPSSGSGLVRFNAAGNAADGDGTTEGDFIYTDDVVSAEEK